MSKIYQLISSIQLGGAELVAVNLASYCGELLGDGVEFHLVELYPTNNKYALTKKEELSSKNVRVITLFNGPKRLSLLLAPIKLIRFIQKEKPFVIHSHTDLPDFVLSVTIRILNFFKLYIPNVVRTIHNTQLWRSHHVMGKITESAYKDEIVVAVSSYSMEAYGQLRKKYKLQVSNDRQIIYNGCLVPSRNPHSFKTDKEKINIAFCGRFEDYKGMETLISTIIFISKKYPNRFLFHIIGDGTFKDQLEKLSQEINDMILYDPIPDVSNMFYAFDYIFMPSHFEGLGLISVEASLAKVPVIASFAPGLDETLPENWPLRFHLNNNEELYSIFDKIHNSEYNREFLQEEAYSFVFKKFSFYNMIHSYSNLYKKML